MNTLEALKATLADLHVIDDKGERDVFRENLATFEKQCPFLNFENDTGQDVEYDFLSDSAVVLTRFPQEDPKVVSSDPKEEIYRDSKHVRRVQRAPGRDKVIVPARRMEYAIQIPFSDPYWRVDDGLNFMSENLPSRLGAGYASILFWHVLVMLMMVAESPGWRGTLAVDKRDVETVVRDILGSSIETYTIITNAELCSEMMRDERRPGNNEYQIGERGFIHLTRQIDEQIILLVPHLPEKIGFVRTRYEPEIFIGTYRHHDRSAVADGIAAAVGEVGFCIWGDAPVIKIDTRKS